MGESKLEKKLKNLTDHLERCIDKDPKDINMVSKIYDRYFELLPGTSRPLEHAAKQGNLTGVNAFIQCAKVSEKPRYSKYFKGHTSLGIKVFLEYTDDQGNTPLHLAARNGHVDVVIALVTEVPELLTTENDDGKDPLSLLTEAGCDHAVFEILEKWGKFYFGVEKGPSKYEGEGATDTTTTTTTIVTTSSIPKAVISIDVDQVPSKMTSPGQEEEPYGFENPMDASRYEDAMKGEIFSDENNVSGFSIQVTSKKNTVLHVAAQFGRTKCVKEILASCPALLCQENSEGENALYTAARDGQLGAVKAIIDHVNDQNYHNRDGFMEGLMTRSQDNDTALLVAVRNHWPDVVFWLTKEMPQLSRLMNSAGVSPLYLAAEKGYEAIVRRITETYDTAAYQGPYGRTALHAAVSSNSAGSASHLLSWKNELLELGDANFKTPFHHAICLGHASVAEVLLRFRPSIGYNRLENDDMTALHIAASRGHTEMMEVIISNSPGCWELTTIKGRNILHIAVQNNQEKTVDFILKVPSLSSLINQKDNDGNTPLHLLFASNYEIDALIRHPRVDLYAHNNKKLTPLDVASTNGRKESLETIIAQKNEESLHPSKSKVMLEPPSVSMPAEDDSEDKTTTNLLEVVNSLLVVATLIATATFAAGLAVPGGFDGNEGDNQGIPILLRKIAFKAFVISNALAFVCSCSAIFGFIWLLAVNFNLHTDNSEVDDFDRLNYRTAAIYVLIGIAMITMVIAFITGLYVVLERELGFAIPLCILCFIVVIFTSVFAKTFASERFLIVLMFVPALVVVCIIEIVKKFKVLRNKLRLKLH